MLRSTSSSSSLLPPITDSKRPPSSAASATSSRFTSATSASKSSSASNEAKNIKIRQMSGAAVQMALKPSRGLRDDIVYAGGKPKDHAKENHKLLLKLQLQNRNKDLDKQKPPPAPFKLKQFEHVKSKLSTHRPPSTSSDPADDRYSRPSTAQSAASNTTSSASRNFIHLNAVKAKESRQPKPSVSNESLDMKRSTKMGELPR
ncbi:hypothetical protein HDU98_010938 [Podochytrium sp. JEL0797]|nr:hypothetical protein HDU98_010938 [Podochytrium sp. JEL0797]